MNSELRFLDFEKHLTMDNFIDVYIWRTTPQNYIMYIMRGVLQMKKIKKNEINKCVTRNEG